MTKDYYIETINGMVGKRFETLGALNYYIKKYLKVGENFSMDFSSQNYENAHSCDWELISLIENEDVYCHLDIYFLWDRYNNLYITEVGYEFE